MKLDESALRKLFLQADPMGLFFEENEDEYDSEIRLFMAAEVSHANADAVRNKLMEIFRSQFEGLNIPEDQINKLANLIAEGSK